MTTTSVCRIVGGALVLTVGAGLVLAGIQLWREGPEKWPDMIARKATTQRLSAVMILLGVLTLCSAGAVIGNVSWGGYAAATCTIVFVCSAFWFHHALFGDFRPLKTGTNVFVGTIILVLLWVGYSKVRRDAPHADPPVVAGR